MTRWAVPEDVAAGRADVALADVLGVSRSRAGRLLRAGRVQREGRVLRPSDEVHPGDVLDVDDADASAASAPPPPLPPVRFRDDHLLVLAKPAGLVVHPGAGHPDGTLVDALRAAGVALAPQGGPERPGIVHRLDRDTSGLLVVACTTEAHEGLVDALRHRRVTRRYLALVQGVLPATTGRVDAPIGRDPRDRQRFAAIESGKPAVTHWEVLRASDAGGTPVALVACRLETGRTHQIRVHMAFAGAPVAGDQRYGASPKVAERLGLQRPFLHAAHLAFTHPVTGQQIALDEPLPPDLRAVLAGLGMDDGTIVP
jgi:23S rRNA pseudouridine1911/1915/1917 synthase